MQNGDFKFVANLEYRTKLFGNLNGAIFLDTGNVWNLKDDDIDYESLDEDSREVYDFFKSFYEDSYFKPSRLLDHLALGTGVGLRYDLGFLVIRIDWGFALHTPYDTGSGGYFSGLSFKDRQTLHFAIGYPF